MIRFIVAIDRKRGMAKNGGMPWNIPTDEKYFTDMTKKFGGNVLSGGVTFREAYKNKPLAERHNYILTRDTTPIEGVQLVHDLDAFLAQWGDGDLWVAGGAAVFEQILHAGKADELYLTHIEADFGCDQFLADYTNDFKVAEQSEFQEENGFIYSFARYVRR